MGTYEYLTDDGVGSAPRAATFAMFSPEGTEAVAAVVELALLGLHPAELASHVSLVQMDYPEVTDTAVRDAMIGSLPEGSDEQRRMAVALDCQIVTPHGTKDRDATRALIAAAHQEVAA